MHIGIVGGGIFGLSAAWGLARAGRRVSLFEQGPLPNPLAASFDRHRLTRHAYGEAAGYARAMAEADAGWEALWADLGERHGVACGTLALSYRADDWAVRSLACLGRLGRQASWLSPAAIGERFPFLRTDGLAGGLFAPSGGVLLADRILQALVAWLAPRARLHAACRVVAIDGERGRLTLADNEVREFNALLLAAGPWAGKLLPGLAGEGIRPVRQVVAYVAPPARFAQAWRQAPALLDIGGPADGYGVPAVAGTPPKLGATPPRRPGDPDDERTPAPGEGEAVLALYRDWLADWADYRLLEARVCYYMRAEDEQFRLRPLGARGWLMTADSGHGFKFGPALGLRLARAMLGEAPAETTRRWAAGELV
ncbi:MAG: FAD-dependent oxidoreductase [Alphaproteobacteria bacterium]|nr:FAD-dependent oxidoreductase [Alphaproteobacteria bacterium]